MEIHFLERLLDAAGPSGFEVRPARVWREEADEAPLGLDPSKEIRLPPPEDPR